MCGLAGIVAWDERYRVTRDTLHAMSARIAHRGPDGAGVYLNHEQAVSRDAPQCGLVHRRLAILDLDDRAQQPFDDARGARWIVFNGEIYNFRALRRELTSRRPDYRWRTECDTEVLLLAHEVWGGQCFEHLSGMFALAVWNQIEGTLTLARDRMGQKPLYYAVAPNRGAIAFASELAALRVVPWFDRSIDYAALCLYLRWGYVPAPHTIYEIAKKLPPAHVTRVRDGAISLMRYFDPNQLNEKKPTTESHPAATRRLLLGAVQEQLVSDVPLGCFLSGGIDSSVVAACMKQVVPKDRKILTFAIGFEDPRYDETPHATAVAKHLGTQHHTFRVTPQAAEDLPKLAQVYGEPFGDSSALPTHYLARETRGHVKVALSGEGGDELFGGYDRYAALLVGEKIHKLPGMIRSLVASPIWQVLPGTHPKGKLARLKRFLATADQSAPARYASYVRLFDDPAIASLLRIDLRGRLPATDAWVEQPLEQLLSARDVVAAATAIDRVTYLPEDLLTKLDRASMLHALEVRSPFMDHALTGFAASLDGPTLIEGGPKRLLREAFADDLPAEVFTRRKMGFAVPIGEWFRSSLRPMLRDLLLAEDSFASEHFDRAAVVRLIEDHEAQSADHSQRLYTLLMLELWRSSE